MGTLNISTEKSSIINSLIIETVPHVCYFKIAHFK